MTINKEISRLSNLDWQDCRYDNPQKLGQFLPFLPHLKTKEKVLRLPNDK